MIVPDLIGFGKSDKYVDWRMFDLDLHLEIVILLMEHLDIDGLGHEVSFVGHDWGWMVGAGVAPGSWFSTPSSSFPRKSAGGRFPPEPHGDFPQVQPVLEVSGGGHDQFLATKEHCGRTTAFPLMVPVGTVRCRELRK